MLYINILSKENENGDAYIKSDDFPKLLESMNTTYCEEEHRKTIRRLAKEKNIIYIQDFVSWYVDWIFAGDEESLEEGSHSDVPSDEIDDNEKFELERRISVF